MAADDPATTRWPEGPIDGIFGHMPVNGRSNGNGAVERVDATDRALLIELQVDARLSLAELGRRVGLSPPAVAERVRRLTDEGVIRGFRTDVDPRAVGFALSAIVRIRPAPRQIAQVADVARETPEVVECHRITGEDCFFVKVHVRDVEHLEEVIDRFTVYGQTTTSVMQTSPVPTRGVAVALDA
jgi:Lrp/AsnC family transcriptional regulator, leucine-responsive regulatory protein